MPWIVTSCSYLLSCIVIANPSTTGLNLLFLIISLTYLDTWINGWHDFYHTLSAICAGEYFQAHTARRGHDDVTKFGIVLYLRFCHSWLHPLLCYILHNIYHLVVGLFYYDRVVKLHDDIIIWKHFLHHWTLVQVRAKLCLIFLVLHYSRLPRLKISSPYMAVVFLFLHGRHYYAGVLYWIYV